MTGWSVGDKIVVTSTSFDSDEAEERTITAINGYLITVDKPFEYLHLSQTLLGEYANA